MGTYCYTMRKKQVSLWVGDNAGFWTRHKANLYSYAYKLSWSFMPSKEYSRLEARSEANAQRAFESYNGGYVIDGTFEDGIDDCPVYVKVRSAQYLDSHNFPGEIVGFVDVRDGRNYLAPHTKWTTCTRVRDNTKFQVRMIIRDGKAVNEERELDNSNSPVPCGV